MIRGGDRFGQTSLGVVFSEHRLALQVRRFDEIAIDEAQVAYARARQRLNMRCAKRAATDNQRARCEEFALPFFANAVE